jgi:hypothetical protein
MAASSSPAFERSGGGGGVLGSGVGETATDQGKRFAGVLVVLVHAKDRALGCCSEPSKAAGGGGGQRWFSRRVALGWRLQREE